MSELNQKVYPRIDEWRNRPISGAYSFLFVDGIWLKQTWGGEVRNVAWLVMVGVDADGRREVLAVQEGSKEDAESWRGFFCHLKEGGLSGERLVTSNKCLGFVEAAATVFPVAAVRDPFRAEHSECDAAGADGGGGGHADVR